jgi:glutathione S-transferase
MVKLYHHPLDPPSRFVRLLCAEYGIEPDLVEERTFERRHEFLLLNPAATLPVLVETGGAIVPGAGAIAEYLDETRGHTLGERRLLPEAPLERIEVRRLLEWFNGKFFTEVSNWLAANRRQILFEQSGRRQPFPLLPVMNANVL